MIDAEPRLTAPIELSFHLWDVMSMRISLRGPPSLINLKLPWRFFKQLRGGVGVFPSTRKNLFVGMNVFLYPVESDYRNHTGTGFGSAFPSGPQLSEGNHRGLSGP